MKSTIKFILSICIIISIANTCVVEKIFSNTGSSNNIEFLISHAKAHRYAGNKDSMNYYYYQVLLIDSNNVKAMFWNNYNSYDYFIQAIANSKHTDPELDTILSLSYIQRSISKDAGKESIKDLNNAIALNIHLLPAYDLRVLCYENEGDTLSAIKDLDKMIEMAPERNDLILHRATLLLFTNKFHDAIGDYSYLINFDYNSEISKYKDNDEAMFSYLRPRTSSYNGRSQAYFQLKQYDKALEDINHLLIRADTMSIGLLYYAGMCHLHLGDTVQACQYFTTAIMRNDAAMQIKDSFLKKYYEEGNRNYVILCKEAVEKYCK